MTMTQPPPRIDLFTLGETMLRLAPPAPQRLEQADRLHLTFGGAESTLAVNLARLDKRVVWHSRLPDNPLGRACAGAIRRHGVALDVTWAAGERLGLYFVEYGDPPRGVRVWYDRAASAASRMTPGALPVETIRAARRLHLTGITPALSDSCADTVWAALDHARQGGVPVSFDVNYRALLWEPAAAATALEPLCAAADLVFVARRDAAALWGASGDASTVARRLQRQWSGTVVVTDGEAGAAAHDGRAPRYVPGLPAAVVDRLGAGDAFASGVLCRLLEDAPLADALRFGVAMAALKLTLPGDVAYVTRAEVDALLDRADSVRLPGPRR